MNRYLFNLLLCCFSFILTHNFAQALDQSEIPDRMEDWKRVYLASYYRSGNHWVRFLIEEATHIATGSIVPDREIDGTCSRHLNKIFPWGGYSTKSGCREGSCRHSNPDEVVVIKCHYPVHRLKANGIFAEQPYLYTIRLVRHPIDSFYSEFVFKNKKRNSREKSFSEGLRKQINSWIAFQSYWNEQPRVITIRYEDILERPKYYLRSILDIIGYQVTNEDIKRAVKAYPPSGGVLKHLSHYTEEDLELIESQLGSLMHQFNYTINEVK